MQSCMQKNEKKHEKWDCGSQVSLGDKDAKISQNKTQSDLKCYKQVRIQFVVSAPQCDL